MFKLFSIPYLKIIIAAIAFITPFMLGVSTQKQKSQQKAIKQLTRNVRKKDAIVHNIVTQPNAINKLRSKWTRK